MVQRELSSVLCDNLEGWGEGVGRMFKMEGICIYL